VQTAVHEAIAMGVMLKDFLIFSVSAAARRTCCWCQHGVSQSVAYVCACCCCFAACCTVLMHVMATDLAGTNTRHAAVTVVEPRHITDI
jgi:hypothetical protein